MLTIQVFSPLVYSEQQRPVPESMLSIPIPHQFIEEVQFSMQMVVPTLQKAGTYYLWPGLQDTGNTGSFNLARRISTVEANEILRSGVYQEVLDGRSGTWWIGAGWCCSNPSLAWGSGFNVYVSRYLPTQDRNVTHGNRPQMEVQSPSA